MSRELIRPEDFAKADNARLMEQDEALLLNDEQQHELQSLYAGTAESFKQGKLITGTIIKNDSDGVLVDIQYKSYGLIPRYEFSPHEIKKIQAGDVIEVILDNIEGPEGNVILSYEKAKA